MGILVSGQWQVGGIERWSQSSGEEDLRPCTLSGPQELSLHLSSRSGDRTLSLNMVGSDLGITPCVHMCLFKQHLLRTHQFRHAWVNHLD